ncbi:MAG: ribulokinase [Arachnia sp.]
MAEPLVVGIDFGTLSGRVVVVRVGDGAELGTAVHEYAHAVMEETFTAGDGRRLPPGWALQHPDDYRQVISRAVPAALADAGVDPADVVGVGVDFTAATFIPVRADGTPLSDSDEFRNVPHAYAKLWKHHAPQAQAERITELAFSRVEPWLGRYGGLVSVEWEFPKALELYEEAPEVYAAMRYLVEAGDWVVWQLGGSYVRGAGMAGYKGLYQDSQYPSDDFLEALSPGFSGFVRDKLDVPIAPLGARAGSLTAEAARITGLPEGIAVAVSNIDAHVTAPAAQAVEPGQLVAIMGTSSCHIVCDTELREVPGMGGVVDGGVVAGSYAYEAGQSGVGDVFAWFVENCVPASYAEAAAAAGLSVHEHLTELAARQQVGEHGLVALDWHSGNRSVLVDHELSGVIVGQTLLTRPEDQYRALIEATAFGTRTIIDNFVSSGVAITEVVAAGGLLKNTFLMQLYADVLGQPIATIGSQQGPALGAAIHGAVAAGCYPDVPAAGRAMGRRGERTYLPNPDNAAAYDRLYAHYTRLHDWFGREQRALMHDLKAFARGE